MEENFQIKADIMEERFTFGSSFVLCSVGIVFETVVRESNGGLRKWREVFVANKKTEKD